MKNEELIKKTFETIKNLNENDFNILSGNLISFYLFKENKHISDVKLDFIADIVKETQEDLTINPETKRKREYRKKIKESVNVEEQNVVINEEVVENNDIAYIKIENNNIKDVDNYSELFDELEKNESPTPNVIDTNDELEYVDFDDEELKKPLILPTWAKKNDGVPQNMGQISESNENIVKNNKKYQYNENINIDELISEKDLPSNKEVYENLLKYFNLKIRNMLQQYPTLEDFKQCDGLIDALICNITCSFKITEEQAYTYIIYINKKIYYQE